MPLAELLNHKERKGGKAHIALSGLFCSMRQNLVAEALVLNGMEQWHAYRNCDCKILLLRLNIQFLKMDAKKKPHFVHNYVSFLLNAILPALFLAMSYSQTSSDLRVLAQVPSHLPLAMLYGPSNTR